MVLLMDGLPLSYLIAMWSGMLSIIMACFAILARYLHNDNVRAEKRFAKTLREAEKRFRRALKALDAARQEGDERLEKEINKNRVLINEVREGLARVGERLARLEGYVMQALPEPSDGDANDGDAKARELLEVVES
ncbi:MAG: hypothetical protein OXF21_02740 [bacterium]|nr:hypothetical protein [bacterium]